ncbi:hypothetical protein [Stappia stellulata]|uniref:hypothetical protein n=1 Tax=Stappia stellulata TaxID=71235 RepID=UPI00041D7A23|nr:hypothetical protein [Stappia stellulata]
MRLTRRNAFFTDPQWAPDDADARDRTALHLATAVAIGLLFAGSLTLFGGPLADGLKALGPDAPAQVQRADPGRF